MVQQSSQDIRPKSSAHEKGFAVEDIATGDASVQAWRIALRKSSPNVLLQNVIWVGDRLLIELADTVSSGRNREISRRLANSPGFQ